MTLALLLLPVLALVAPADGSLVVSVEPATEPGCPAPAEVEAALRSLLRPGTLVAFAPGGAAAGTHRLAVILRPEGPTASHLRLVDGRGGVRLERRLTIGEGEGAKDCAALAQTAAFIIERYLVQLDYRPPPSAPSPPPPPPPPSPGRWELGASAGWVPERSGRSAFEGGGRLARQMGASRGTVLSLGLRVAGQRNPLRTASGYRGQAVQRAIPLDLGLWWRTKLWRTELRAGGGGALEMTRTRSEGDPGRVETRLLLGPALWAGAALHQRFLKQGFVNLSAALFGSVVQYDFSYRPPGRPADVTAFTTPPRRFYSRLGIDLGVVLP